MLNTREETVAGNTKQGTKMYLMTEAARNGFTLVELIVVVAILAILAGIATHRFAGFQEKARETVCRTNRLQLARLSLLDEVDGTPEAGSEIEINGAIDPDVAPDQFEGICPSGGVISKVDGVFRCSIHPDETSDVTGEHNDGHESDPEGTDSPGAPDDPEEPGDPVPYL
jgi:prepilin-type N-terminal cleavage/methylation domain-containing protein